MASQYDLFYTVGADTHDLESAFRRIEDAVNGSTMRSTAAVRRANSEVLAEVDRSAKRIAEMGDSVTGLFRKLSSLAGFTLPLMGITGFLEKVKSVRSEFQDIESTMRIFLGSAEKAEAFVEKLQAAAYYNMFDYKDLVEGSKQMLAYGVNVDQVIPRLNQLSEIATATHASLGQMVSMYDRAKSIGYVDSRAMQSWAAQGLVIKDVLREMGENANVTKVTFEQLNRVLDRATSEGGMFYGVMDSQMQNISAEIGQLRDNTDLMLNDIGKSMQEPLHEVISLAATLVDHWKEVGVAIATAASLTLSYKAGAKANEMMDRNDFSQEGDNLRQRLEAYNARVGNGSKKEKMDDDLSSKVQKGVISQSDAEERQRLRDLDAEISKRKETAVAIDEQTAALRKLREESQGTTGDDVTDSMDRYEQEKEAYMQLLEGKHEELKSARELNAVHQQELSDSVNRLHAAEQQKQAADDYLDSVRERLGLEEGDENNEAITSTLDKKDADELAAAAAEALKAEEELQAAQEAVNTAVSTENASAKKVNSLETQANKMQTQAHSIQVQRNNVVEGQNTVQLGANSGALAKNNILKRTGALITGVFSKAVGACTKQLKAMWAAMVSNPIGLILTGISLLLPLLMDLFGEEEQATEESERFGESALKAKRNVETLFNVLKSTKGTSKAHRDALAALRKEYEDYGIRVINTLADQVALEQELIEKKERLITLIMEEGRQRQLANAIQSISDDLDNDSKALKERTKNRLKENIEGLDEYAANMAAQMVIQELSTNGEAQKALVDYYHAQKAYDENDSWENFHEARKASYALAQAVNNNFGEAKAFLSKYGADENAIKDFLFLRHSGGSGSSKRSSSGWISQYGDQAAEYAAKCQEATDAIDKMKDAQEQSAIATEACKDAVENLSDKTETELMAAYRQAKQAMEGADEKTQTYKDSLETLKEKFEKLTGQKYTVDFDVSGLEEGVVQAGLLKLAIEGLQALMGKGTSDAQSTIDEVKSEWRTRANNARSSEEISSLSSAMQGEIDKLDPKDPMRAFLVGLRNQLQHKDPKRYDESDGGAGRRYQAAEKERTEKIRLSRQAWDNKFEDQELETFLMEDGYDKERQEVEDKAKKAAEKAERAVVDEMENERKRRRDKWVSSGSGRDAKYWKDDWTEQQYRQAAENATNYATELKRINAERAESLKKINEEELQDMRDYFKDFGTLLEQRFAIEQEYDEKIRKARAGGKEWQAEALEEEKRSVLGGLDARELAMDIDWGMAFDGVGTVLEDMAKDTLDKVEKYMKTDAYKNLSATDKQVYVDLREKLRAETESGTSVFNFKQWGNIAKYTDDYKKSVEALQKAQDKQKAALEELKDAEKELAKATTDEEKAKAEEKVKEAAGKVKEATEEYKQAEDKKNEDQDNLNTSTRNAVQGLNDFSSALSAMNSGSLRGFATGMSKLIANINGADSAVSKFLEGNGKMGGMVGAILEVLDAMGDDPAEFIMGLIDKIGDTIAKLLADLPNLAVGVLGSVGGLFKNIAGGFLGIFGADLYGGNQKDVARATEYLTASNNRLRESIDNLSETISKESGIKALEAYNEAMEKHEQLVEQQRRLLKENEGEWGGGHHSNAYYANQSLGMDWSQYLYWMSQGIDPMYLIEWLGNGQKGISDDLLAQVLALLEKYNATDVMGLVNRLLGMYAEEEGTKASAIRSIEDIIGLSPEELAYIRDHEPELWAFITSLGYNDKQEYWEGMADLAGEGEKLNDAMKQSLTQTSFDSLKSSFVSALSDMGKDASSFADDFSKMLFEAVLNARISDALDGEIEQFYDDWAEMSKDGLDSNEAEELQRRWEEIVQRGIAIRDEAAAVTGYEETYRQSASGGGFATASQDSINELSGRFLAVQVLCTDIREAVLAIEEQGKSAQTSYASLSESMALLGWYGQQSLDQLEEINRNTRELYQMNERLGLIEQHTKTLE